MSLKLSVIRWLGHLAELMETEAYESEKAQ